MDNLKSLAAQMRKAIHSSKPNTHFTMMIRLMDQIDAEIKNLEQPPVKEVVKEVAKSVESVEEVVESVEKKPTKIKKSTKTSTED